MNETNDYAMQTFNLTKVYRSKVRSFEGGNGILSREEKRIVTAIDHLNLNIKKGELFGLLGPNGAGKTTLVKVLCTLLPPDEGTARLNGYDVSKQQMQVKKSIGTLFSIGERGFFWRLSGYSNLEFYAAINNVPRGKRKARIMEVLELVDMKQHAFEHFQKYSGGMKRKLALARALLADPPILLLDEPTTGLDVMSSRSIREFIHKDLVKSSGKTVLYTTHYIEEAAQICDRVAIMNKGKIIALDTPEALKNATKKEEVIELIVQNITERQVTQLRSMEGVVELTAEAQDSVLGQLRLRIRLEDLKALPKVFDFFFKEGTKLVSFKHEEPTLEDAFIKFTGAGIEL